MARCINMDMKAPDPPESRSLCTLQNKRLDAGQSGSLSELAIDRTTPCASPQVILLNNQIVAARQLAAESAGAELRVEFHMHVSRQSVTALLTPPRKVALMTADPLSLLATACCTPAPPEAVPRIATGTASAFCGSSSSSPKSTTQLGSRSPRHSATMSATTTPATAAVRLPPCASLYAAGGGSAAFAAKSESEDGGLAPFPSPNHAPTGSASPASLAYYALAPSHCGAVNGPRLGEEGTAATGEPSHLPLSTANHLPASASAELVQLDVPTRTTTLSPRARQRPSSPTSVPRSAAAEPTGAKPPYPHRSFANLLAIPQQHDLAAHHSWSGLQAGQAGSTVQSGNGGRTSSSSPRPSISGLPQGAQATSLALADPSKPTSAGGNASVFANVAPYPPTPPEPTSATLHGLLPSSVSAAASSSYPGDSRPSSASNPSLERCVSVTLSTQDELADDSGAASGSQGEGSASCQDKAGGKPKKELKGSSAYLVFLWKLVIWEKLTGSPSSAQSALSRTEQRNELSASERSKSFGTYSFLFASVSANSWTADRCIHRRENRSLQELVSRIPEFEEKLASLSAHCASLEADRSSLLAERQAFLNERASWDRERRCLLGEIDALRRVLNVEKASVGVGMMPPVVGPAPSVGPLSPKSGSGSHSADASPSPRPSHYDAPLATSSDHRRASTSGSGSFQSSSMAPPSAYPEAPLRNEVKREAPDDFGGQPPSKRFDLHA